MDAVIERTNIGVPNFPALFKPGFPWVEDFSARFTNDSSSQSGTFNALGMATFRTLTARQWTYQNAEGKTQANTDFDVVTSLADNHLATHPDQRKTNLLCRDLLFLSMALDDKKAVTDDPALRIQLDDGQKAPKQYYKEFERHLGDENKDAEWTERHSEITLSLATKAEELSAFFWNQRNLPQLPQIDTTSGDRRQSWESVRTPEEWKGEGYDLAKAAAPESTLPEPGLKAQTLKADKEDFLVQFRMRHGR